MSNRYLIERDTDLTVIFGTFRLVSGSADDIPCGVFITWDGQEETFCFITCVTEEDTLRVLALVRTDIVAGVTHLDASGYLKRLEAPVTGPAAVSALLRETGTPLIQSFLPDDSVN